MRDPLLQTGEQIAWVIPHILKLDRYIAIVRLGPGRIPFGWVTGAEQALCLAREHDAQEVFKALRSCEYDVLPPVRRIVPSGGAQDAIDDRQPQITT